MTELQQPESKTGVPRRTFFGLLTYAVGAIAAGVAGVPLFGFFFGVRKPEHVWVRLDQIEKFVPGTTRLVTFDNPIRQPWDGMCAHTGVYVRRHEEPVVPGEEFSVFAVNCAHLGCPVEWFPESGLFMCPCHGGVYYANGDRASGPPPRGLYQYVWQPRDGYLEIQAPHYPTLQDTLRPHENV